MKKLRCIQLPEFERNVPSITVGKIYRQDSDYDDSDDHYIIDDSGRKIYWEKYFFEEVTGSMIDKIIEKYEDETFLKADGFDEAVIGVDESDMRLIYSVSKCIDTLMLDGMSEEDAIDYFTFNVSGSYVGDKTPIWCWDDFN